MNTKRIWALGITLISLLSLFLWGVHASPARAQTGDGVNLLVDGDFETHTEGQTWPWQDGIPEVQAAPGWHAFYLDQPPAYATIAGNCRDGSGGRKQGCEDWGRPEFRDTSIAPDPFRVHSGLYAQKYFSWNRQHEAGLYQQVSGITPGQLLRFTIYVQTWSCAPASQEQWNNCPTQPLSNNPAAMHVWAGIDPTGGTNPFAATVVRSPEGNAWDVYTPFTVEAVAQSSTVTVFMHSWADWAVDTWPRIANDVYVDDGSLVVVGSGPAPTAAPPPAAGAPAPTTAGSAPPPAAAVVPLITATPGPDGSIVHTVQPGDTLYGLAWAYDVPIEQIEQLNPGAIGANRMIQIGQRLTIKSAGGAPAPAPTEAPTAAPVAEQTAIPTVDPAAVPAEASPTPETAPAPATGEGLCVLAFNDRNGDTFRQADLEELLPNATISVSDATGPVGQYITDGMTEPYCFTGRTGTFHVTVAPPAGYTASGPADVAVALTAGRLDVFFGMLRSDEAAAGTTATPGAEATDETPTTSQSSLSPALRSLFSIGAIVVVVLVIIVVAVFVLSRRRR